MVVAVIVPAGLARAERDDVEAIESLPNAKRTSSEAWDDFVKLWLASGAQRLWRSHSDTVNRSLLGRWLPPNADRILKTDLWDEAVSDGLYPALAMHARQVVGIDVSTAVVDAALERHPALHARCADVRGLPFTDGAFDVVVSNSTLDHFASIDDIQTALVQLHRVTLPGGTLVVTLDNPSNPIIALRRALPRSAFDAVWQNFGELAARIAPSALGAFLGLRSSYLFQLPGRRQKKSQEEPCSVVRRGRTPAHRCGRNSVHTHQISRVRCCETLPSKRRGVWRTSSQRGSRHWSDTIRARWPSTIASCRAPETKTRPR
jgi:SAM-dependent methyltransferase